MSKRIVIGSMNIQNKYKIPDYDGLDDKGNDNAEILKEFLDDEKIDILGTQELVRKFIDRIKIVLKPNYKIYGNFRYGNTNLVKRINFFDRYNETVSVITKHKVLKCKTVTLPWIPNNIKEIIHGIRVKSLRPRVATIALIEIENFGKINFINTHLDHRLNIVQIKQLAYLQKIIEKAKYPVVLVGDFNMDISCPRFSLFVDNLKKMGYQRVPNARKTYKYQENNLPIDHIFIPSTWNIEEVEVVRDKYLNDFSDHYPMIVRVSK